MTTLLIVIYSYNFVQPLKFVQLKKEVILN